MTRKFLVQAHIVLAGIFAPLLILIPLSGGLYLLGIKGDMKQTLSFQIEESLPENEKELRAFFEDQFSKNNILFTFEKIKISGNSYIFRPSNHTHYMAVKKDEGFDVFLMEPSLVKSLVEVHKGHGPSKLKTLQTFFGVGLLLLTVSGFILALTVSPYRRVIGISTVIGCLLFLMGAFL